MWQSFILLFAEMPIIVYILFIVGIVLCAIEMFVPGFGIFGISGGALLIASMVIRLANNGDIYMLLYMLLFAVIILTVLLLIISRAINKGKLGKSAIFDVGTSVPEGRTEGTKDYSYLVGKTGKTVTLLRPIGSAEFDNGVIVDVIAKSGSIDAGTAVKVVYVEGQKVVVEEI